MPKRKNSTTSCIFLFSLIAICLGIFVLIVSLYNLQQESRSIIGFPDAKLSYPEKIYLSLILLLNIDDLNKPTNGSTEKIQFTIEHGEPTSSIISRLKSNGLIPDERVFSLYLRYRGLDKTLQAGDYQINTSQSPIDIANMLQDATPNHVTFNILAGWRIEEISAVLANSGLQFSIEEFSRAVQIFPQQYRERFAAPERASVEGFLFPDSYSLLRTISVDEFIWTLISNFDIQVNKDLREGFSQQGLTVYQAVTLASLIEREAIVEDEMPIIASVFYNRLNKGMKLDSDATVQYALGYEANSKTWWTNPITAKQLKIDSPYNTYIYPGLPPSPICNPSLAALSAVAKPAKTNYLYFRASCEKNGRHIFAESYEQHLKNACQ